MSRRPALPARQPPAPRAEGPPGTLAERMRRAIEGDIVSGRLPAGEAIDEAALAAAHGVSRTPVREALLWLAAHDLVEIRPRAGTRVRQPAAAELVALLEALAELEGLCTRLAAQRMTAQQRQALARAQREVAARAAAGDRDGYAAANERFHGLLYEGSGNPVLVTQLQRTRARLAAFRRTVLEQPGRLATASREHQAIVEAVLAGDADAATRAMRDHVLRKGKAVADVVLAGPGAAG